MTIQFANPIFLLLIIIAPLLMWRQLIGKRTALRYPIGRFLSSLPAGRARAARWAAPSYGHWHLCYWRLP